MEEPGTGDLNRRREEAACAYAFSWLQHFQKQVALPILTPFVRSCSSPQPPLLHLSQRKNFLKVAESCYIGEYKNLEALLLLVSLQLCT